MIYVSLNEISEIKKTFKFLFITANDIETDKFLNYVKPLSGYKDIIAISIGAQTYHLGMFGAYPIVHVRTTMMGAVGRDAALNTTRDAIEFWKPKALLMVGVAFGNDNSKQKIGDVLVSESVIQYEIEKIGEQFNIFRGDSPRSGTILLNRFKNFNDWNKVVYNGKTSSKIIGKILSGEKLIDNLEFKKKLFAYFPEAIGGEMEGSGLYAAAAHVNINEWIIVKGICDWADGNKKRNKHKNQMLAAEAAVSLCHSIFSQKSIFQDFLNVSETYNNKANNLKQVIGEFIINTICQIDKRLDLVNQIFIEDEFDERINDVRKSVIPNYEDIVKKQYRRVILENKYSSLLQIANRYTLDVSFKLADNVVYLDTTLVRKISSFNDGIREVNHAFDNLLSSIRQSIKYDEDSNIESQCRQLDMYIQIFHNVCQQSNLIGLNILYNLFECEHIEDFKLNNSTVLEIKKPISNKQYCLLFNKLLDEYEKLLLIKQEFVNINRENLDTKIDEYKNFMNKLEISDNDTWNIVVAKAITLRQFGHNEKAIETFSKVRELFNEEDFNARLYSDIAKKFTKKIKEFNVSGGIYIYKVKVGGVGDNLGIEEGDILLKINEQIINDMNTYVSIINNFSKNELYTLTFLTVHNDEYEYKNFETYGTELDVYAMPI